MNIGPATALPLDRMIATREKLVRAAGETQDSTLQIAGVGAVLTAGMAMASPYIGPTAALVWTGAVIGNLAVAGVSYLAKQVLEAHLEVLNAQKIDQGIQGEDLLAEFNTLTAPGNLDTWRAARAFNKSARKVLT